MELFSKVNAFFKRKQVVLPPAPLFSDEEFLEFIAAQTRNRLREEQTPKTTEAPSAPLNKAA